jgi:hypothetical protein
LARGKSGGIVDRHSIGRPVNSSNLIVGIDRTGDRLTICGTGVDKSTYEERYDTPFVFHNLLDARQDTNYY